MIKEAVKKDETKQQGACDQSRFKLHILPETYRERDIKRNCLTYILPKNKHFSEAQYMLQLSNVFKIKNEITNTKRHSRLFTINNENVLNTKK